MQSDAPDEAIIIHMGEGWVIAGGAALTVCLFIIGIAMTVREERRSFGDFCARVAGRLGGTFEAGSGWMGGTIRFQASGRPARLRFFCGGRNEPASTGVEVDLRGRSPGVLKIFPEDFGSTILRFFGGQDIVVGDRTFDSLYVVRAVPEALAHGVFSPERRARVVACVRRLSAFGNAIFDLGLDRLVVSVGDHLREEARVLVLVEVAKEFLGYVMEAGAPGDVRWLESPERSGGQCQVCGTEMRDRIVLCARCRTPHHEECWLYMGECSTFACKERRYVAGGRTFRAPDRRQTPEEWLRGEIARDRRDMVRREAEESVRRFERRQREREG